MSSLTLLSFYFKLTDNWYFLHFIFVTYNIEIGIPEVNIRLKDTTKHEVRIFPLSNQAFICVLNSVINFTKIAWNAVRSGARVFQGVVILFNQPVYVKLSV